MNDPWLTLLRADGRVYVVAAHGGRMSVASETGVAHGTSVTLRLPVGEALPGPVPFATGAA